MFQFQYLKTLRQVVKVFILLSFFSTWSLLFGKYCCYRLLNTVWWQRMEGKLSGEHLCGRATFDNCFLSVFAKLHFCITDVRIDGILLVLRQLVCLKRD